MEINVGLKQGLCVGFAAVSPVAANDLDAAGVAAEGLEDQRILFLEDIPAVKGNDLQIVGDYIGVAVRNNVVFIVERGVLAAEDDGDALAGEGLRHFHQGMDIFQGHYRSVGEGLEYAGVLVGGVPCAVGKKDNGGGLLGLAAVIAYKNVQEHLTVCILQRPDGCAVEELGRGIVGIAEAHGAEQLRVHRLDPAQLQLHQTVAVNPEVIALEITVGKCAASSFRHAGGGRTLWPHINAGGKLFKHELSPRGHVDGITVDAAIDLRAVVQVIHRAQAAALIVEAKQSVGCVYADCLAVVIQEQQCALGQTAFVILVQNHSDVPVHDAAAVLVAGDGKVDDSVFAVRHVADVHALSARGGDDHGALGIIVVGGELAVFFQNRCHTAAVGHQCFKVHAVGENAAVRALIEVDILAVFILCRCLDLASGGVDGSALIVIHQTGQAVIQLSVRVHQTHRLQGLDVALARLLQLGQNLHVCAVQTVAVEGHCIAVFGIGIGILELKQGVHGLAEDIHRLLHLGAVHQRGLRQVIDDAAVRLTGIVDVDIVELAVGGKGSRPVFYVEDACGIRRIVHKQIAAGNLLVAAVELFATHGAHAAFYRSEGHVSDFIAGAVVRVPGGGHGEILVFQLFIAVFLGGGDEAVHLFQLIGADTVVIDGVEGVDAILYRHCRHIAAFVHGDGDGAAAVAQNAAFEIDAEIPCLPGGGAGSNVHADHVLDRQHSVGIGLAFDNFRDRIYARAVIHRGDLYFDHRIDANVGDVIILDGDRDLGLPVCGNRRFNRLGHRIRDESGVVLKAGQILHRTVHRSLCCGCNILRALRIFRLAQGGAEELIDVALHKGEAVGCLIFTELNHMIERPVKAQLFQQIQLIADGNGGNFGDFSVLFLDEDVGEIDVGAVGQGPCQLAAAGHIDRAAGLADIHGDAVVLKVDHLGDLVPVHVSDLADLSVGKGEAQIAEIVAYAVCLSLRSQELQLAVLIAHPEDKLVGQQVEALVVFGVEQVIGQIDVCVLAVMLDGAVSSEDIVGIVIVAVFVHILDERILADIADFGVIAAAGLEHIQIGVVLQLGHHLAGGLDAQIYRTGHGVDFAQGQLGIVDLVDPALRVLAVHEHMSELGPDVAHGLHGDVGIPLRLGDKAVVVGPGDLRDIGAEGAVLCADASGSGDGELVCPEPAAGFGVEQAAVHADIHAALGHILVKNIHAVGGPEDHIALLFGDDAQAGQLVHILGLENVEVRVAGAPLQERGQDEADVQIGSGLLSVDQGDLVDIQIPVGAIGDHHIGQEAAVINADQLAGIGASYTAFVVARRQDCQK